MWTIYMHRNIFNNKSYIGQTKDIKQRFRRNGKYYLNQSKSGKYNQPKFAKALIKYGWNNFEHIILETNISTLNEANEKEKYYISKFNSIKNGYNIREGGVDSKICYGKKIFELDSNKNILKEFSCSQDVSRYYGWSLFVSRSVIKCCKGIVGSIKGKYFCFVDDYDNYMIKLSRNNKVVYQLDDNLNIVNRFNSLSEAAKYVNNELNVKYKNTTLAKIRDCCLGNRNKTRGYYWSYEVNFNKSNIKKITRGELKSKNIAQYTLDNKLIKIFKSSGEIQRELNILRGNVCSCCRGELNSAYGYIWRYVD